jgi:hypothetical protein
MTRDKQVFYFLKNITTLMFRSNYNLFGEGHLMGI